MRRRMPKMPSDPSTPKRGYAMISSPEAGDAAAATAAAAAAGTAAAAAPKPSSSGAAKMGFASTGSCIVALTNTILGSGMLGLPHAFSSCGYLLGLFFLVVGGMASSFGLHLLACSAVRAPAHRRSRPCAPQARRPPPAVAPGSHSFRLPPARRTRYGGRRACGPPPPSTRLPSSRFR